MPSRAPNSRRFRLSPAVLSLLFALPAAFPAPLHAQDAPTPIAATPNARRAPGRFLLQFLNTLDYDTTQYVPLIVVNPMRYFVPDSPLPEDRPIGLPTLAEASHLRVVTAGRLNALVPPQSMRITAKPAKANPFGNMKPAELVKLLLGSLTAAQWQIVGSENGIGIGDLDDDQRLLWADIMPRKISVQKSVIAAGKEPGSISYENTTMTPVTDLSSVHLRISKKVTFSFSKKGSEDYTYGGGPDAYRPDVVGETKYFLQTDRMAEESKDKHSAFGVTLLSEDVNVEKVGDVGYDSASLDPGVSLHFEPKPAPPVAPPARNGRPPREDFGVDKLPTVGDLIERISAATRLTFVADRRVRDLPVYLRGDRARSGDLLRGLARSVCGTFRALPPASPGEPTIYLLTSDREGTGTSAARFQDWADDAESAKYRLQEAAAGKAAKQNPLAALHFAPDDPYALPQAQADADEAAWRKEKYAQPPAVRWDDLTPALQQSVQRYKEGVLADGVSLRTDRMRVGEELATYLVVPGAGAIREDSLGYEVGGQYLSVIAYNPVVAPTKPAAPAAAAPTTPFAWPVKLTRRVLVAAPATPDEAAALARDAHVRGFTELWLQVGLADPDASARTLAAGVGAGAAVHLPVGGVIPILRDGNLPGEPDRDLLGETGADFGARRLKADKDTDTYDVRHYSGWVEPPTASALSARVAPIASVPGLASLAFRNTVAPGWGGEKEGGDDLWAHFGYTLRSRRAFLAEYGIDPVDIVEDHYDLNDLDWTMGYFTQNDGQGQYRIVDHHLTLRSDNEVPRLAWSAWRAHTVETLLTGVYADLRKAHPALPLFLDDRLTPYAMQRPNHSYFGSWDAANRFPDNPPFYGDNTIHDAAREKSKTILGEWGSMWESRIGTPRDTPPYFATRVAIIANANPAPAWDGIVIDVPFLPTSDVLRLLTGLPPVK